MGLACRYALNCWLPLNTLQNYQRAKRKMTPADQDRITQYLRRWSDGSDDALEEMLPHVYAELRTIASRYRRRERGGTLQTTEIINEAYLRLSAQNGIDWKDRSHFFAVAARIMRHMLVDRARAKLYGKRGGGSDHISLDDVAVVTPEPDVGVIDLNDSLERLARIDERKARIIELRYFGGLSADETAAVIGVSEITVKREWLKAKAWLYRDLSGK